MVTVNKGFRFPYSEERVQQYVERLEAAKKMPATDLQSWHNRESAGYDAAEALQLLDMYKTLNEILEDENIFVFQDEQGKYGYFDIEDTAEFLANDWQPVATTHKELAEIIYESLFPAPNYEPNEY